MDSFNNRLKELRSQSGMSQLELANKLNVTKQTISQYERGVREPDYDYLLALCDVFNVSADYLLGKADVTLRLLSADELRKLSSPSDALSPRESQFLGSYRSLNDDGKQAAETHMEFLKSQEQFRKDIGLSAG